LPTASDSRTRIPELDGLRGLAILLVILCHYVGGVEHHALGLVPHRLLGLLGAGWSGVDLFFILSGFLIGGILLDVRDSPHYFRAFYMRRVFRILPVYYLWVALFAVTAALVFTLRLASDVPCDVRRVVVQLLFLQNLTYSLTPLQWIWFSVTWSLAVEEQFYLLAPPLIRFLSPRNLLLALASTICLAPVLRWLVFRYLREGNYAAVFAMPCRADALALGILLALLWRADRFRNFLDQRPSIVRLSLFFSSLAVAALFWWFVHSINIVTVTIGYMVLSVFYSCLLLMAISQRDTWIASLFRVGALRSLGAISYCVYIIHLTFDHLAHRILLHASPEIYNVKGVAVTLLALLLTITVASLSWRFFEKPLLRRGHTYSYGAPANSPSEFLLRAESAKL